ncbi:PAS domain-containing protein [Aliikangiella coralliicola]|nr:PAS domain S-box protein [Aliikangiella coralliicola]
MQGKTLLETEEKEEKEVSPSSYFFVSKDPLIDHLCPVDLIGDPINNRVPLQKKLSVFDEYEVFVLLVNSDGEIAFINQKGCEVLNASKEKVAGLCWLTKVIPEKQRTEMLLLFDYLMTGSQLSNNQYFHDILTFDGTSLPYKWINTIINDKNGKTQGMFCLGADVRASDKKLDFYARLSLLK